MAFDIAMIPEDVGPPARPRARTALRNAARFVHRIGLAGCSGAAEVRFRIGHAAPSLYEDWSRLVIGYSDKVTGEQRPWM